MITRKHEQISLTISTNIFVGFGATIMIINGGIECGHGYEKPQATIDLLNTRPDIPPNIDHFS